MDVKSLFYRTPLVHAPYVEIVYDDCALHSTKLRTEGLKEHDATDATPPAHVHQCLAWFEDFFCGHYHPIDWKPLCPRWSCRYFARHVYETLSTIPAGDVITYGELARRCGSPNAARAIGQLMNHNPFHLIVPCHRVISKSGSPLLFALGPDVKRELLCREGIKLDEPHRFQSQNRVSFCGHTPNSKTL